jgi:hypothetical protein
MMKADYFPVAPDPHFGGALPDVEGCTLELVTREDLAARHEGKPKAPMILEYVGPHDYKDALKHLRGAMQQAGLVVSR